MKAKALMVLGTASGVGKSVIAAGFCRVLSDAGCRVAPFKAQNMSNNSFVTAEGGEMGRAQVVQAECARVRPHTDMNPVLLKPGADNHSQVVIHGKAVGHFSARDYYAEKALVAKAIRESYERLAAAYEILVIEGAGSPAEVNLKENDLVNMKMAELADASCVLVGDIDRGGVFASLIGTLDLLESGERDRVAGLLINKFRGDETLLAPGLEFLERRTGKKVWGVVPYDRDLWIEAEDAVSVENSKYGFPIKTFGNDITQSDVLDIAVLLLPRISNFTDFEILKQEPGVALRYVKRAEDLGSPDLLILPGTKATFADLACLDQNGFREKILNFAGAGGRILGICGGYQMMGRFLRDPEGVESHPAEMQGLGFFEMATEFYPEKVLRRVQAMLDLSLFSGRVCGPVQAYEIHMGQTVHHQPYDPFGEGGAVHPSGRLAGTYYHGLFESGGFRKSFLDALARDAGKKRMTSDAFSKDELKEIHYGRLAGLLTGHLNLKLLETCLSLPSLSASIF